MNNVDLEQEYEFEEKYYSHIAGTKKFTIIQIPDVDGTYPTDEEKFITNKIAREDESVVLYQILLDNGYIVIGKDTPFIGVIPLTDGKEIFHS